MITLFFPSLSEMRDFRKTIESNAVFMSFEYLSITGSFSEAEVELAVYGMNAVPELEKAN